MVRYKKYFYALRPLLAARYIEEYREPAPVLFDALLKQELPAGLREAIRDVMAVKLVTDEKDEHPQNAWLQEFISRELERQEEAADRLPDDRLRDWSGLNAVFLKILGEERQGGWSLKLQ